MLLHLNKSLNQLPQWLRMILTSHCQSRSAHICRCARACAHYLLPHLHLRPRSRVFARSDFATIPRSSLHAASLPPRLSDLAAPPRRPTSPPNLATKVRRSVLAVPPRRSVLATTVRLSVLAAPPRLPTSLGRPTGTLGARTCCCSVTAPRQVAALSPGSYLPPPFYMSVRHRRPWAKSPQSCMFVQHQVTDARGQSHLSLACL